MALPPRGRSPSALKVPPRYRKAAEVIWTSTDQPVCAGTVARSGHRLGDLAQPTYRRPIPTEGIKGVGTGSVAVTHSILHHFEESSYAIAT